MSPPRWPQTQADIDRFWSRTLYRGEHDCILWTGPENNAHSKGGCFKFGGRTIATQRFAWELVHGQLTRRVVRWLCLCGNQMCVNEVHWEPNMGQSSEQLRQNHVDRERKRRVDRRGVPFPNQEPTEEADEVEDPKPKKREKSNGRPVKERPLLPAVSGTASSTESIALPPSPVFRRWCEMLRCDDPAVWIHNSPLFGEMWLCESCGAAKEATGLFTNRLRRVEGPA